MQATKMVKITVGKKKSLGSACQSGSVRGESCESGSSAANLDQDAVAVPNDPPKPQISVPQLTDPTSEN